MRRISIFGATGSIGQNTLDLVRRDKKSYKIVALTGGRNIAQLVRDAREFHPDVVVTAFPELLPALKEGVSGLKIEAAAGGLAICEAADRPADWIMSAIVGIAGLAPSLNAVRQGATLALANKESLVTAGPLLLAQAAEHGAVVLPVDSEHSAVFQALLGEDIASVERIIITASGGAFRDWPQADLAHATPAQAQTHPNWLMGRRITIDSASMFNKAMELIETKEFFEIDHKKIEVLVHSQSIVHALVCFCDGGMLAHLSDHNMKHAINYALNWPSRRNSTVKSLDLTKVSPLSFENVREDIFPVLKLARAVMDAGGLRGTVFNAAKEIALDRFISSEVGFLDMNLIVEGSLDELEKQSSIVDVEQNLENIVYLDSITRQVAKNLIL